MKLNEDGHLVFIDQFLSHVFIQEFMFSLTELLQLKSKKKKNKL